MPSDTVSLTPASLMQLMLRHRFLLLAPAVAGFVIAAFSTLVIPRDWKAQQGLLIRSDAAGYADQRLGKFTDLSEMKTVQETLLELARSRSVVAAVLTDVLGAEPTHRQIADFREKLRLTPPGGAEFGKTEIFYVAVLDPNRDRAIAYVESLTRQLDLRLTELREQRAGSMVAEVERSVAVSREQLHQHVLALAEYENSVGADLIELRHLTSPNGGQSEMGQNALAIESERRQSIDRRRENEALLAELQAAVKDPTRILATPDALLNSQPALRRLKNGLIDAQLAVARAAGVRTPNHPLVLAARRSQMAVQDELASELPSAIAGVQIELQVSSRREEGLTAQLNKLHTRSAGLAGKRSTYAELVANVEGQTSVLEGALKQLADAKAHKAGAHTASLLAEIDRVEAGVSPVGPGRTTVAGAGGLAGLLLGATLVFVLHAPHSAPAPPAPPRYVAAAPQPAPQPAPVSPTAVQPTAVQPTASAPPRPTPAPVDSPWGIELARAAGGTKAAVVTPPLPVTNTPVTSGMVDASVAVGV